MSPQQTSQSCGFWLSSQSVLTFDLRGLEAADAGMDAGTCSHYESEQHFICPWGISKANFHGIEVTPHVRGVDVRNRQDRKSTRLNSSHGYISYAVFCLKKKKKHMSASLL